MTPDPNIVITGLGVVSPIGIGKEAFWSSLCAGRSGIHRLGLFDDPSLPSAFGGEVSDFDPKQYVRPRKSLKVMSRDIQLGFTAADLACVDAALRQDPTDPERFGVVLGAEMIPLDLDELAGTFRSCTVDGRFDFTRWGQAFPAELFPLWMLKYLPNMPACHIGIAQDARGPNNSVTLGDVSSLAALAEATRVLERGQADVMIAGGVSAHTHGALWARHYGLGQTSRSNSDPSTVSRPFDARRDGLVNGEGSAAFVLERRSHAVARGVRPLARLLGFASSFEPCCNGQVCRGDALRRAIVGALQAAKLTAAELGYIVAHGVSTVPGDRLEAQAIRDTLGDVPVTAPKSYFGYLGAAAGSLEVALGVLSFEHGLVPATLNYEYPDPQCPINVIHGQARTLERPVALVVSYSTNGQAVAVVLAKDD